jgi:hypothetical protein
MKLAMLMLTLLLVPLAAAEEITVNPQYAAWAKFKPNTRVVVKGDLVVGDRRSTIETTFTLREVKAEQITLDVATRNTINDKTQEQPAKQQIISARIDGSYNVRKKAETESIDAMGKSLACDVYQFQTDEAGGKADITLWLHASVPGPVKTDVQLTLPQQIVRRTMLVQSVNTSQVR